MKAISVYALTREQNIHHLQKLERQLSERDYFLKIKEWELNSMKGLVKQLEGHMKEVYALRFFYSFQIPKLGKEFDLLQIKEDQILNLECSKLTYHIGILVIAVCYQNIFQLIVIAHLKILKSLYQLTVSLGFYKCLDVSLLY